MQHAALNVVNRGPAAPLQVAVLRSASPGLRGPVPASRDLDCLTAAVYYEARGEGAAGQAAVAQVVLNRTRRPEFPKSVCGVVYQGAATHACQFSFACDGLAGRRLETGAWVDARQVAARALAGHVMAAVGRATHFHVSSLGGVWGGSMTKVAEVGDHSFYVRSARHAVIRPDPQPAEAAEPARPSDAPSAPPPAPAALQTATAS